MNPWYEKKLAEIKKLSRQDFQDLACDVCGRVYGMESFLRADEYVLCDECVDKLFPENAK